MLPVLPKYVFLSDFNCLWSPELVLVYNGQLMARCCHELVEWVWSHKQPSLVEGVPPSGII